MLDFINESIENQGDNFDKSLPEKKLSDYFGNFLMEKEFNGFETIIEKIGPDLKMKHTIQFFFEIVTKIQTKF